MIESLDSLLSLIISNTFPIAVLAAFLVAQPASLARDINECPIRPATVRIDTHLIYKHQG